MAVAVLSKEVRIVLSGDNGANNSKAGYAGDVADDVIQLDVHLMQCFLDMLDVCRTVFEKHFTLARDSA